MKKQTHVLLLLLLSALILFPGCEPYEDGPAISFRSKKERVANTWEVEYAVEINKVNENVVYDITEEFENSWTEYRLNGSFTSYFYDETGDSLITQDGLWDLVDEDTRLRLLYTDPPTFPDRAYFTIRRLREKSMWVRVDADSVWQDIRLIPKE